MSGKGCDVKEEYVGGGGRGGRGEGGRREEGPRGESKGMCRGDG